MNKKLLLGLLALAAAHSAAEAQSGRPYINREALRNARPVRIPAQTAADNSLLQTQPTAARSPQVATPASWGQMIGQTTYDLQTNRATANRLALTGTALSAVWTQSCNFSAPGFANRGIGYNFTTDASVVLGMAGTAPTATFNNGATGNCGPGFGNFGIATVRTGWPEVAHSNGNEVVVAHSGAGIAKTTRPAGSGSWTPSSVLSFTVDIGGAGNNGTWPRMLASGSNLHMIYTSNGSTTVPQQPSGVINPMVYSRSTDGGTTWDQQNVFLPGMDATNFDNIGGDSYAIGVNGSNVAIAAGSFGDHTVIWKSMANGDAGTFMPRIIQPDFTDADTILLNGQNVGDTAQVIASDGSMSVVIDNSGTVHWFSGSQLVQVVKDPVSGRWIANGSYFPDAVRGMLYWNDRELSATAPQIIIGLDNECPSSPAFMPCALSGPPNGGQTRQWYNVTGSVSMPTAITNANGEVYVIYASGRIGTSNDGTVDGQYFRDLYLARLTFPGGNQVAVDLPKNISRDIEGITDGAAALNGEESVYPSALHTVENNLIHYTWMSDFEPGNALQPDPGADPEFENAIMYDNIQLPLTWTPDVVITGRRAEMPAMVQAAYATPNPTTGRTVLSIGLQQAATATITVRNVLGQEVLRLPAQNMSVGMNTVNLDLSNEGAGVYFYTVSSNKFSFTKRVVKQ